MSNIRVNVGTPDDIPVPNTGVLTTTTGTTASGSSTFYIGIGVITTVILVVVLPIILVRKGVFKRPVSSFSLFSKKKLLPNILILALLSFGMTFSILDIAKHNTTETQAARTRDITNTLTIVAEDLEIDIGIDDEPVYKSAASVITVETGTDAGYTLSAYASNPDFVAEENPENKIHGLTGTGLTTLSENTWGISLTAPESQNSNTWQAMPATKQDAIVLKTTDEATAEGDQTTVYYGIYVNSEIPYGTYSGVINYVAVATITDPGFTVIFHGDDDLYFDEDKTEDVNIVHYAKHCEPVYGYIGQPVVLKTPNLEEDGTKTMPYYDYDGTGDDEDSWYEFAQGDYGNWGGSVRFEGAKYLKIEYVFDADAYSEISLYGEENDIHLYGRNRVLSDEKIINGEYFEAFFSFWVEYDSETGDSDGMDINHNYGFYTKVYPIYDEEKEGTTYQNNGDMCSWYVRDGQYKELINAHNAEFDSWESDDFHVDDWNYIIEQLNTDPEADSLLGWTIDVNATWSHVMNFTFDANGGQARQCIRTNNNSGECLEYETFTTYTERHPVDETVIDSTRARIFRGVYSREDGQYFTKDGYRLIGWSMDPNATTPDYSGYGSIHGILIPQGEARLDLTFYAVYEKVLTIQDLTYLQDFNNLTAGQKSDVISSMEDNTSYSLLDNRDDRSYSIAKLKYGVWMVDNLDLGRTTLETNLTSENTNLSATVTADTFNSWKKETRVGTYDDGEFIPVDGTDSVSGTIYGTLYNYYAVTAGTIYGSYGMDAQYDICPAGWKLPNIGDASSLINKYSTVNSARASVVNGGAAISMAGRVIGLEPLAGNGYYWTSSYRHRNTTYSLTVDIGRDVVSSTVYEPDRNYLHSIRCKLK